MRVNARQVGVSHAALAHEGSDESDALRAGAYTRPLLSST